MQPGLLPLVLSYDDKSSSPTAPEGLLIIGRFDVAPAILGWLTMPRYIYINEDNDVVLSGVRESYSGDYVTSATVTADLKNQYGTAVASAVSLSYVSGTDGDYRGTIDKDSVASLTAGEDYYVEVTVTAGEVEGFRRVRMRAAYHGVE